MYPVVYDNVEKCSLLYTAGYTCAKMWCHFCKTLCVVKMERGKNVGMGENWGN